MSRLTGSRMKSMSSWIFVAGLSILGFQNCGSFSASSTAPSATSLTTTLLVSSNTYSTTINATAQITASGGTAPYTYSVSSGGGVIDPYSGVYTAGSAGSVTIMARDQSNRVGYITISVLDYTTGGGGSGDDYYADCSVKTYSTTQSCYAGRDSSCTVSVNLNNQIPAGCKVTQARVYARHFSAETGSCSMEANLMISGSGTTGSGQMGTKTAYLTVTSDLETGMLAFTSRASGWGTCGGAPCNACVSDIRYEVYLEPKDYSSGSY